MENVEMDWGRAAPTPRQLAQRCIAEVSAVSGFMDSSIISTPPITPPELSRKGRRTPLSPSIMSNTDPSVERASQASKNSDRAVRKHVGRLQRQIATALEDMAKGMEAGLESERAHLALMQRQIDSQAIRLQRTVEVLSARLEKQSQEHAEALRLLREAQAANKHAESTKEKAPSKALGTLFGLGNIRFPTWSLPFFSCCQTQRPSLYDHYDGADSPQPSAAPEPATPRTRTTAPRPALLYSPATPARHMPTACSPRPVGSGEARAEPAPCDSDDESSPLTGGMSLCQENDREESAAETGIAPAEVELTEADRREPVRGSPGRVPSGIVARRLAEMGPPELLRPVAPGQMSGNEEAQIFLAKPATRVR